MENISVGKFKARFSEILEEIRQGKKFVIQYGKKKKKVAVLLPYEEFAPKKQRKIGILKNRARVVIKKDFKMTDEEILSS
jgi:antitoxin (DNA-binding transcriptional repressor) of toxin-antitoxin stability system